MINGSTAFNNAVNVGGYPYTARIKYNNEVVDCNIITCSIIKGATGNEEFSVGTGFVPYIELGISDITTNLENKEIVLEIGVYVTNDSVEWITIGYFTVTKAPASTVRTTITAVGRISAVLTGIIPSTPATITVSSLINAIQTAVRNAGYQDFSVITTGVTIPTDVLDINITGLSCYDILGELAKILGCYVTENNAGNVVLFNYDTTNVIGYGGDRMIKHPVFNSYDFELGGIKVVYEAAYETEDGESVPEKFFTTDPPIALTVQNPYITTESLFNTFCDNCLGLSYRPADVILDYGDPRLEPFDVLKITDTNGIDYIVPCMYLTHTITGGLVTNIVAPGQSESEESSTTAGPLTQQLEKMSAQLLSVNDAVINRLKVTDLTAQRISAIVVDAINLTSDTIDAKNISVSQITATQAFIDALNAGLIDAGVITVDDLTAGTVSADLITAINLAATQINADSVNVTQLVAKQAFLDAVTAQVATLGYAHITNGVIDNATIDYADVNDLNTHYASIDLANVNNAWVENGVIKDAAISDAQIIGVSANKLTAGTIDASNITVTNLNADNITTGTINGQRIGSESITLDKLAEEVPTKEYLDNVANNLQGQIDGQIETWTGTVVPTLNNTPASAWTTADDRHKHVGDIYYVVNAGNTADGYTYRFTESGTTTKTYSWTLIKDNQITKALQDILDMQGNISDIQTFDSQISSWKTNTDDELSSLKTRTSTLETNMGKKVDTTTFNEVSQKVDENSANITSLSSVVDTKADGSTVTTLSNTVNTVSQKADSNSSKITSLTQTLGTNADGTTKAEDIVHRTSAVEQDLSGFKTTVSETYQTKSDMSDYSTTAQMNSAIKQKAGEISLSVAQTEISKIEVGGRNLLSNSQTITKTWSKDNATVSDGVATVTCVSSGNARIYQQPNNGYWTWQANQDYTVSVDAKASTSGLKFNFYAVGIRKGSGDIALTTDWKRYTCTVSTTSVSTENGSISFSAKNGQSGTVQFRNPKLEYGNKATDWTPAPEDLENYADGAVATAKAEIKVTTDGISTEVAKKVGNSEVISKINQSAETVKIEAGKVEIDGTAIFNNSDFQTALAAEDFATSSDIPTKVSELTNDSGYQNATQVSSAVSGKADKTSAVARQQRIYYRTTSSGAPSKNTTWLSSSGTGYGNWSLKIPQMTSGSTKYPYLYTAVQTQTVAQQAAGTTCTCSDVLLNDTTTVIDGGNILTNSIGANQIAANAITSNELAANSVIAGKIATGAVTADKIAVNSITANKLRMADYNNYVTVTENDESSLLPNGGITITDGWCYKANASNSHVGVCPTRANWTKEGEKYRVTGIVKAPADGQVKIIFIARTASGTWQASGTYTQALVANTETAISGVMSISSYVAKEPFLGISIQFQTGSSGNTYQVGYFKQLRVERMSGAELIVDGSITTDKLAANAVTIGKIASNTQSQILNSEIEVGGRNLLRTAANRVKPAEYHAYTIWTTIPFTDFKVGDKITVQLWDVVADSNSTGVRVFWGGGNIALNTAATGIPDSNGYLTFAYTVTESHRAHADAANAFIRIYNSPSGHSGMNLTVGKWKLERGTRATDWTPSPENVDADIAESAKTADTYISVIDDNGIKVHAANNRTSNYAKINADGMEVYQGGVASSSFGANKVELAKSNSEATISLVGNNGIIKGKKSTSRNTDDTYTLSIINDIDASSVSSKAIVIDSSLPNQNGTSILLESSQYSGEATERINLSAGDVSLELNGGLYLNSALAGGVVETFIDVSSLGTGSVKLGVGSDGTSHGVYSNTEDKWLIYMSSSGYAVIPQAYAKTASGSANVVVDRKGSLMRSTSSSRRYKKNIEDIENADALYDVKVRQFKYKEDYLNKNDQRFDKTVAGFIVEELNEVYPIAVDYANGVPEDWNVRYIVPPMLKLIQEQKCKIEELENRIKALEERE